MDLEPLSFLRISSKFREEITSTLMKESGEKDVAESFAKCLALFQPQETDNIDDEILFFCWLELRDLGLWRKIPVEQFLTEYGEAIHASVKKMFQEIVDFASLPQEEQDRISNEFDQASLSKQ